MNKTKFKDDICNLAEDIGFLSFDAKSAACVLRLIVEDIDEEGLSEQPYAALPGALNLVEAVAEKLKKIEDLSNELLRLTVLIEKEDRSERKTD